MITILKWFKEWIHFVYNTVGTGMAASAFNMVRSKPP